MKSVFLSVCRFVKVKASEFNCAFGKGCVKVQHMVSAVIVVLISSVIRTVCSVPDVGKLSHGSRFFLIQLFNELWVYRSAVSVHSATVDFQGICDQLFVACHQVGKISEGLWGMSVCSDVDVNPCPNPCVADCSGFSEDSHQFLQGFDVLVFQNRCDQFAFFAVCSADAYVSLKFPFSALCIPS